MLKSQSAVTVRRQRNTTSILNLSYCRHYAGSVSSPRTRNSRLAGVKTMPFTELVNERTDLGKKKNVNIITLQELYRLGREKVDSSIPGSEQNDSGFVSSRSERLNASTLKGKASGDKLLILPDAISSVVSNSTVDYSPNRLRTNASRYYISLVENGAHRPANETLDVDTHLSGVFLQNYASLHNVLKEARQRLGVSTWRPNRILDVGFGPATGIVALNEVFNDVDDWDPERKLSIVIGHRDMKKRAISILATQKHENVTSTSPEKEIQESEETEEIEELEEELSNSIKNDSDMEKAVVEELFEKETAQENISTKQHIRTSVRQQLPAFGSSSKYDLIIATHQLYRSGYHYPASVDDHTSHLLSLLSPGGILIFVERGDPTGFETIARARQIMFRPEDHQDVNKKTSPRLWTKGNDKFNLSIVAPCPHHGKCPLQVELGIRNRGKDPAYFNWCKFAQMVQRPRFALELKKGQILSQKWSLEDSASSKVKGAGGKILSGSGRPFGRSYETATHSYIIVQREGSLADSTTIVSDQDEIPSSTADSQISDGQTAANSDDPSLVWPRIMRSPIKRDKHVIMEVCSPSSHIEQWTITQGFNKEAYHDARKSNGGDLWALGAKVVQVRGGNKSKIIKAVAKLNNNGNGRSRKSIQRTEDRADRAEQMALESALASASTSEDVSSSPPSPSPSSSNDNMIDLAWLKNSTYQSEKTKRNDSLTRGSEPSAYDDIDGGFSEEYFENLAEVFNSKRSRDYEKKLQKDSHVEKKTNMKW